MPRRRPKRFWEKAKNLMRLWSSAFAADWFKRCRKEQLVAYSECFSTDRGRPPVRCSQAITDAMMSALTSSKIHCDRVVGITSRRIATSRNGRAELAESGATVVDMESYSIATAAAAVGVPSVVLR